MKVKIGKYKNWFGPFQLAELLCFWVKDVPDEYGIPQKPEWVHKFGEILAYGSIEPEQKVGERRKFMGDRPVTWLYKFLSWIDNRTEREIKIQIDPWDTYSMDHTLALIILPMLKQLKEETHGAPCVDDEDVPEHLRSTAAPAKENEWDTDDNHFKRWDWALSEMIFAFERIVDDEWENEFYTGTHDTELLKTEDGLYQMVHGPNDTFKIDYEGLQKVEDRIANGTRLFGKYYRALWD